MSRGKYTPEFKAKIVLEVLQGERELGAIAAENNLNPNMVRNWKAEFVENASSIFEEQGKAEREVKRKEAAAAKERDKMLKTIGQLTVERNFLQDCFRAVGKPVPELNPEKQRWLNSALVSLALFIEQVSPIYELIGSRISSLALYFSTASRIRSSPKVRLYFSFRTKSKLLRISQELLPL